MKIWEKHLLAAVLRIFFLFLGGFILLYLLFDYSSRGGTYRAAGLTWEELGGYYFFTFIQKLDILFPVALIIATVKTLTGMNTRNESIALLSSGISLKAILRPLILFACFLMAILYVNTQLLLPTANRTINHIKDARFKDRYKVDLEDNVRHVETEDGSLLIFHGYDTANKRLYDVYWVPDHITVYRMKLLSPFENPPTANLVDLFKRDEQDILIHIEHQEKFTFPKMKFDASLLTNSLINPKEESLTRLLGQFPPLVPITEQQSQIATAFYHKLLMPWLCLLAVIAPAPFCLRFTRQLPIFFIYLISMIGIVTFYLIMNAAVIMGDSLVINPLIAICSPFILYGLVFGIKYKRMA